MIGAVANQLDLAARRSAIGLTGGRDIATARVFQHTEVLFMEAGSNTGLVAPRRGSPAKVGFMSAVAIAALIAVPATTFAAKGGGTTSAAWISLANGVGAAAAAQPRLGSDVKFSTGYPSTTKNPWVSVMCYQGSTLVYGEGGRPSADFVLGGASSSWVTNGGAATCHAELGDLYWKGGRQYYTFLASMSFDAGA
jgi:hypothetical protein